ncbi:cytochrome c maturation protein CcmE [Woodsholea maritima]|uniref:cytochrome c maturation protein CcmE n=1 Tax=Woodsholea maritima TaxID=240237 RepID=UPI000593ABE7|nr:cytochrome c maturation protein CcmE [Woodsholea maritima]
MRKSNRRLWMIGVGALVLVGASALAVTALRDAMVFFYAPGEIAENPPAVGERIRVGGLVVAGSVSLPARGGANFTITDGLGDIAVSYEGSLPDLFREGQGIVAEGAFDEARVFRADTVLAKHDENYMPPEVADALKKSGLWNENGEHRYGSQDGEDVGASEPYEGSRP